MQKLLRLLSCFCPQILNFYVFCMTCKVKSCLRALFPGYLIFNMSKSNLPFFLFYMFPSQVYFSSPWIKVLPRHLLKHRWYLLKPFPALFSSTFHIHSILKFFWYYHVHLTCWDTPGTEQIIREIQITKGLFHQMAHSLF